MPQADGFPDRQRDENVENRSNGDQDQNYFDDCVCPTESGASAHLPFFHVFAFSGSLPLGCVMDFDTANHDENDD